jgi:hypothetical protein
MCGFNGSLDMTKRELNRNVALSFYKMPHGRGGGRTFESKVIRQEMQREKV